MRTFLSLSSDALQYHVNLPVQQHAVDTCYQQSCLPVLLGFAVVLPLCCDWNACNVYRVQVNCAGLCGDRLHCGSGNHVLSDCVLDVLVSKRCR